MLLRLIRHGQLIALCTDALLSSVACKYVLFIIFLYLAVNDLILKRKQQKIEKNIQINQPLSEVSWFSKITMIYDFICQIK